MAIEDVRAGMNVTDDALAGRDRGRETVLDGVAGLIFGDGRVGGKAVALVPGPGVGAGVDERAVVGVDDVARGAAARSKIAGMVVGAQEVEGRVEEPGFLQADEG